MSADSHVVEEQYMAQLSVARHFALETLEMQGYDVSMHADIPNIEFHAMFVQKSVDFWLEQKRPEEPSDPTKNKIVYVKFFACSSFRTSRDLHPVIDQLYSPDFPGKSSEIKLRAEKDALMVITPATINETITADIRQVWETARIFVVIRNVKSLLFNVLKHEKVPRHRIITDEEVEVVMRKYNISDRSHFPDISRFDPVAAAILLRPGDVCHIIRPSKTAIHTDYYRICI